MSIISPSTLVANSNRVNEANRERIVNYLNEALGKLTLNPGQTRVERLFLVSAKEADIPMIEHLMRDAGYATVNAIARPAGRNETDVVLSFTIPPKGE